MKQTTGCLLLAVLLLASAAGTALAQDDAEDNVYTIEIRDGKLYVNDEMVRELDGDDSMVIFRRDDGGEITISGADDSFVAFGDLFDRYRYESGLDDEFGLRGENFSAFFPNRRHGEPFVFNMDQAPLIGRLSGDGVPSAEVMRLERDARELANRIRRSDGDTADLEQELDETLGRIFDEKMETRSARVAELEEQLQGLRDRIAQRETDREEIIRQRKQELLGRRGRYEW